MTHDETLTFYAVLMIAGIAVITIALSSIAFADMRVTISPENDNSVYISELWDNIDDGKVYVDVQKTIEINDDINRAEFRGNDCNGYIFIGQFGELCIEHSSTVVTTSPDANNPDYDISSIPDSLSPTFF